MSAVAVTLTFLGVVLCVLCVSVVSLVFVCYNRGIGLLPGELIMASEQDDVRHLVIVLGDQLDEGAAAFDGFDAAEDVVFMAEVADEATRVWSHKARIALFFSAMRHFRDYLLEERCRVRYRAVDDPENAGSFSGELAAAVKELNPQKLIMTWPGEWRVLRDLEQTAERLGLDHDIREDTHFLCSIPSFAHYAEERKELLHETFYREMRRKRGCLMEDGSPVGGKWNLDKENRSGFGKDGPPEIEPPRSFEPDETTREVLETVDDEFLDHPGELQHFDWPVTRHQARQALKDFVANRLPNFGTFQDALWTGEPFLYHSRLSSALNLKLLTPEEVLRAAEEAYHEGHAPLNSVEGFVRQVLGWREYVRGIYWLYMPEYATLNALEADMELPAFYWTGETDMNCLRECIGQTLDYGYAHHIQRLMVTGLFALLLGVRPKAVHEWYLAVYVDAVEWVEMPNTLGMSQFADDGLMATKPYCATGKYITRMSNYCEGCRYDPDERSGEDACPFTTLYWDFLARHRERFEDNPRMALQVRNLDRIAEDEVNAARKRAEKIRQHIDNY